MKNSKKPSISLQDIVNDINFSLKNDLKKIINKRFTDDQMFIIESDIYDTVAFCIKNSIGYHTYEAIEKIFLKSVDLKQ